MEKLLLSLSLDSPLGPLRLGCVGGGLSEIRFADTPCQGTHTGPLLRAAIEQLCGYFEDPFFRFDLPLVLVGTPFQRRLWHRLQQIPVGSTCTYGELARELRTSPRAVGNACRANPVPIVVPCHRVLAANGLGGYAGATGGTMLRAKAWLLRHEGIAGLA